MDAEPDLGSIAALALRESFGDRKPIDISRKITACVACRKQKIKCRMLNDEPPCVRCKNRGLSCSVNRSLQMILEEDVSWKTKVEHQLRQLQENVEKLKQERSAVSKATPISTSPHSIAAIPPRLERHQRGSWEIVLDLNRGPGVVPASVLSEISDSSSAAPVESADIVDRGIISLVEAEKFFRLYFDRFDHFVYRILDVHDSLASVRKSSPLLTAAICVVGALHTPSSHYQACYDHFVHLVSLKTFSKRNSHDDVRALCIGAFWLSDISWTLVSLAARLAGELNMHRCITKAPHTKRACYQRTRLYYHVYVCNLHFSIAYGRPPLVRDFTSITPLSEFLRSDLASQDDARLASQVEIWSIGTRVFDQLSLDPEARLPNHLTPQIRRLSIALDTWRADWQERLQYSPAIGNYPRKGVTLHYYFAKLFLCSHVFRRAPLVDETNDRLEPDLHEFAQAAINAALSILQTIMADHEIQSYIQGLPAYFHTMIAFAFVFLLKITIKNTIGLKIERETILSTLKNLVTVLTAITAGMHPQHILTNIASSTGKLLERMPIMVSADETTTSSWPPAGPEDFPIPFDSSNQWLSPTDAMFLENYDFFSYPNTDSVLGHVIER